MNEDFFDYLVATNQVDDFLGYKHSDIVKALCLCAEDILNNNYYVNLGTSIKPFAIRFDFTGNGYRNEELVLFE